MLVPAMKKVLYDPSRFNDVETIDEAVNIILTPEEGMTSKQRWSEEAPALMYLMGRFIAPGSLVLDYGCGIGRLSKPLIQKMKCRVVGVDISPNMRALGSSIVDNPMFVAMDPLMFDEVMNFSQFDAAIAVWALQHCIDLQEAINRIAKAVRVGGILFLVNNTNRLIPIDDGGWADDGKDVRELLKLAGFEQIEDGVPDEKIAPGWMQKVTFWAAYKRV